MMSRGIVTMLGGLVALAACGAPSMPKPPADESKTTGASAQAIPDRWKNKCDAAKGQLRPLVVDWAAPDRAALVRARRRPRPRTAWHRHEYAP